tara:strand:- start:282 stop:788 length:507 start_codon:yes stop_codon:yes gene_type:complete
MKKFIISSLFAAGIHDAASDDGIFKKKTNDYNPVINNLKNSQLNLLAGHSSHSSHGSHGSHGSHRSSSGHSSGYTPTPAPKGNSTTPKTIPPKKPKPNVIYPGTSEWTALTKQVQAALFILGYYNGSLDGIIGTKTRMAISKYQKDYGLKITGNLNNELVKSLDIPGF